MTSNHGNTPDLMTPMKATFNIRATAAPPHVRGLAGRTCPALLTLLALACVTPPAPANASEPASSGTGCDAGPCGAQNPSALQATPPPAQPVPPPSCARPRPRSTRNKALTLNGNARVTSGCDRVTSGSDRFRDLYSTDRPRETALRHRLG